MKLDEIELLENISRHPVYSIAEDYGGIETKGHYYRYDPITDRLVRSTKSLFEEQNNEPTQ